MELSICYEAKTINVDDPLERFAQDVAANIRRARLDKGLTMVDLAKLTGMSKQYIYKVEMGTPITLRTLVTISLALKVSPAELIDSNRLPSLSSILKYKG